MGVDLTDDIGHVILLANGCVDGWQCGYGLGINMTCLSPQTYSKAHDRYPPNAPVKAIKAKGAWVKCVRKDGTNRWYLDTVNGLGTIILGHCHPRVTEAIIRQAGLGISLPLATDLEYEVADKLLSFLTWDGAELVRFAKNGADVTGAAVRIARAVTGRDRIAYNGYHGHHDWSMGLPPKNGGVPEPVRELSVKARDLDHLRRMLHTRLYACYIFEPIVTADPVIPDATYFREIRELCDWAGTLFIADEMVTGFRMALGGACEVFGIEPDMACYGKAMANGMPLSALVGRKELLERINEDVFFSTTHGGEMVSLAASLATMEVLESEGVPARINEFGREIMDATGATGYPARPVLGFTPKQLEYVVGAGVLCQGYVNVSLAHCTDWGARRDLLATLQGVAERVTEVAA